MLKKTRPIILPARNYYDPCLNPNTFFKKEDGYEIFYNWSGHDRILNKGFIYQLKCQPGLSLAITRQSAATAFSVFYEDEEETNYVSLFFVLCENALIGYHNQDQKITFGQNQGHLVYTRNCKKRLTHFPANPFCVVGVLMEPWFIKRLSQGIGGEFARKIEGMLAIQKHGGSFGHPVSITSYINVCIHEILGCHFGDARRALFLGSKALELVMFSVDQFTSDKGHSVSCFDLAADSLNFVHKAKDIIISDIKNPPSLAELSKMVGVNRTTLSQGFRKAYGVTIFDFLRRFRLEKSRRLLRAGNQSVTEVAFEVGYAQQRTFSKEFKKYFGDMPSAYLG